MAAKLRVGVLGGWRGLGFVSGYQGMDETEVAAGCDALPQRRRLLEDAVVRTTYASYVVKALDMGCHVQSEVPAFSAPANWRGDTSEGSAGLYVGPAHRAI
jgi:hypothetical protein